MENILNILENAYDKGIYKGIVSSPFRKSAMYSKIVIEKVIIKEKPMLRFSCFFENKVKHINIDNKIDAMAEIENLLKEGYKQWDVFTNKESFKLIMNKKYNYKKTEIKNETGSNELAPHNKVKNYILKEGEVIPMLIELGIMNKEGQVYKDKQKKFRQLNKFLEIISDTVKDIKEDSYILDFGCGKSYLTFALYYYLNIVLKKRVSITGLDLKEDVISFCNDLAKKCNYDRLKFITGNVSDYKDGKKAQMMISLHACDTATDYALSYAVNSGIPIILSVPCCQHELFNQVKNDTLLPLLKHGILKERFSALLTDSLRGILLESKGYKVNIMEFIESEHTPKNILIKAVKTSNINIKEKKEQYQKLAREFHIEPIFYKLLNGEEKGES